MTTYNLTTWDRLMITNIIGDLKGDARLMRRAGKILDAVEMSEDERAQANIRQDGRRMEWDNVDHEWPVEINDPESVVLLKEKIASYEWIGAQHKQVLRLCSVLGVDLG